MNQVDQLLEHMLMEVGLLVRIIALTDDNPDIIEVVDLTDDQNQDFRLDKCNNSMCSELTTTFLTRLLAGV